MICFLGWVATRQQPDLSLLRLLLLCWLLYVPATCYSVSQGRICSDNCMHSQTDISYSSNYLIRSQYTDTWSTSFSADRVTPGVWQRLLFVGCLTSQQHANVSQGRICSDNFRCFHAEIEVADQTFYLTQSQYTDTGPTSPSADPITSGVWQGSHWSANF